MSLATLKKKTQTKYNNMSVNSVFNLNGTTRNQGYIGQTSLSRSLPKTIMKGPIMHGYGTCCIKLPLNKPIISGIDYNNDFRVIKTSVKNTKGMLADRKVRYLNSNNESNFMISSLLVVFGSFAAIYVIIISGQAFPLNIFNDYIIVESSFYDNVIHNYTPSLYEIGLGIGGVALSLIIILIAIRNLDFLPSIIQIRKPLVDEKSD